MQGMLMVNMELYFLLYILQNNDNFCVSWYLVFKTVCFYVHTWQSAFIAQPRPGGIQVCGNF